MVKKNKTERMFHTQDFVYLVSEGVPMVHLLKVALTRQAGASDLIVTEAHIHKMVKNHEIPTHAVTNTLAEFGHFYEFNGDRFVPVDAPETPEELGGDEVNLCDVEWLKIGSTDEYKKIKEAIGVVCRDVAAAGCINEICIHDILYMFNKYGFKVVKK